MKYIKELREGERIAGVYLCKHHQSAVTKNGKAYENVVLQDKTGILDAKIWDLNSGGIGDFDSMDYVDIVGDVTMFNGQLQASLKRVRKVSKENVNPADYLPCSKYDIDQMYENLLKCVDLVENQYLSALLAGFFKNDQEFIKTFKYSSAAKSIHHSFIGGLLEHTLSVAKLCYFYCKSYPVLNRDLLLTAAILHDVGKTKELSPFPMNDYTDDGQLLGHIMIGAEMIHDAAAQIPGFPKKLEDELKHCILAHHGELEYGSPKKPALAEAMALNLADLTDARMETMTELLEDAGDAWLGYNRIFESNIRRTGEI